MSYSDPLGDMFTRIRNGLSRGHEAVKTPASKLRAAVLDVLVQKGYIAGYESVDLGNNKREFTVSLKYYDNEPVIRELRRVSKPSLRVYSGVNDLQPAYNGLGIYILSTPKGVMSDYEARESNVGGEVLGSVY